MQPGCSAAIERPPSLPHVRRSERGCAFLAVNEGSRGGGAAHPQHMTGVACCALGKSARLTAHDMRRL